MEKKFLLLFALIFYFCINTFAQTKNYYYQNGGMVYRLSFYTDKDNDYVADAYCLNLFNKFGYKGKNQRGQLKFQSFTFVAEQKMVSTIYSPFPVPQMTGRVVKSYTSNWLFVSPDYSSMTVNGVGYTRISKEKYDKIVNGTYNSGGQSYGSGSNSNGKMQYEPYDKPTNRHGTTPCKGCDGTGRCHYCNGYGYIRSYDDSKTTCATCHGSGRCGVCYGKGSIRY